MKTNIRSEWIEFDRFRSIPIDFDLDEVGGGDWEIENQGKYEVGYTFGSALTCQV